MGDVVRFPVEKIDPYFDVERYLSEPALILILPVVRIDREEPDHPPRGRHRRRDRAVVGELLARSPLLSPGPEARVRGAFNALDEAFRFARQAEYSQFPSLAEIAQSTPTFDPGTVWAGWPWDADTGDETD